MSISRPHPTSPQRSRRLTTAAGLAVAAALTAAAPAPATASVDQNVAADPAGRAHIAWKEPTSTGFQTHERMIAADGSLGPAQSVSWAFRPVISQGIGVDDAGNAVIGWSSDDDPVHPAFLRVRSATGALTPTQQVSPAGVTAYGFRFAVEPDGDAVAVWSRDLSGKDVVQARRRAADGTLGPIQTLSYAGGNSGAPDVAVRPDGTAVVAWIRTTADGQYVQVRAIAPDGSLSDTQRLSATTAAASNIRVTVSDGGTAVVSWQRFLDGGGTVLESRARNVIGALGVVQTVAPAEEISGFASMAGNGAGRVAYAWRKVLPDSTIVVKGRIRQANGALGPMFDVSDGEGVEPRLAIDAAGHTTFVWKVDTVDGVVKLRRRTAAGAMGPVRTVSDPADDSSSPHVGVDPAGKATVVWTIFARSAMHTAARTVAPSGDMSPIHQLGA